MTHTPQTRKLVKALPATLPQIIERTGYPLPQVLMLISVTRALGANIVARRGEGGVTEFVVKGNE